MSNIVSFCHILNFRRIFYTEQECSMKQYIRERVVDIADYLIAHKCTVRAVADIFCVSKSTAHKDLSERLPDVDGDRYKLISEILSNNWDERYVRGGISTHNKYKG